MKQFLIFLLLMTYCGLISAQSRYRTTTGEIRFNASTPLEDIDAVNNQVNAIINAESGDFAVVLLIRDFRFRRKLMQEHFNENFMETDAYPKAYFRGRIAGFPERMQTSEPTELRVDGELTIHGVSRRVETTAILNQSGDKLKMSSGFIVKPENHRIKVPRILFNKIAEEVKVDVNLEMAASPAPE